MREHDDLGRPPIAVHALSCGLGIEILELDDFKVVWRWSDEKRERTSVIRDDAFRAGQQWHRLSEFERCNSQWR